MALLDNLTHKQLRLCNILLAAVFALCILAIGLPALREGRETAAALEREESIPSRFESAERTLVATPAAPRTLWESDSMLRSDTSGAQNARSYGERLLEAIPEEPVPPPEQLVRSIRELGDQGGIDAIHQQQMRAFGAEAEAGSENDAPESLLTKERVEAMKADGRTAW